MSALQPQSSREILTVAPDALNSFRDWLDEEIDRLPQVIEFRDGSIQSLDDITFDGTTFKRLLLQFRDLFDSGVHNTSPSVSGQVLVTPDAVTETLGEPSGSAVPSGGESEAAPGGGSQECGSQTTNERPPGL